MSSRFLSSRFASLSEYVPGEQPRDRAYIKLNTNESPYPPPQSLIDAVCAEETAKLNLYPDPDCKALTEALAARYGVKTENVFLANGSDDILNFSFMGFCDGSTAVAFPEISYGFYEVYANLYGLEYTKIPLKGDFSVDYRDYCGLGKTVVIANPNAQTGVAIPVSEIEEIVKTNPDNLVLVDEAYVDFGWESCVPLTTKYPNILVCQTFSKSRSLAGARLGFAIGCRELIADLNKLKYSTNPYNINRLSQIAGAAAIAEDSYFAENCRRIANTRDYVRGQLIKRGFYVTDSSANFLLAKSGRIGGGELYLRLKQRGVLVRHFSDKLISDYIRVTIGTKEQMERFLEALDEILGEI